MKCIYQMKKEELQNECIKYRNALIDIFALNSASEDYPCHVMLRVADALGEVPSTAGRSSRVNGVGFIPPAEVPSDDPLPFDC